MKWSSWLVILAVLGVSMPLAAQEAPRKKAAAAKAADEAIDFARARELRQKQQKGEKLTADEEAFLKKAVAAFQAKGSQPGRPAIAEAEKTGFKPLTEMTADDRYKDQDGGLYGKGRNSPPDELRKAAEV